jgi:RNA polymerase sigma factor (TIGR02999 family)
LNLGGHTVHDANESSPDRVFSSGSLKSLYGTLRQLARSRLRLEAPGISLQATELVHEVYLRLWNAPGHTWESRGHFLAAAAEAMRRILVERARAKARIKRGGIDGQRPRRVTLQEGDVLDFANDYDPVQVLAIDQALRRLEERDARAAKVVVLRFFGGLDVAETAEALRVSERTVMRDWTFGRAWLFDALGTESSDD